MITKSVLHQVAEKAGILNSYVDAWGKKVSVSDEILCQLLTIMGHDTTTDSGLIHSMTDQCAPVSVDPVTVVKGSDNPVNIKIVLGKQSLIDFTWHLNTEQGDRIEGRIISDILYDNRSTDGTVIIRIQKLPHGYHQLFISDRDRQDVSSGMIIVTPLSCYKQPELLGGKKLWGISTQLYSLKSRANWGIGDFGDLKQLVVEAAEKGADYVGVNPMHALFPSWPENASPYSPSSRYWLNILYIDVCSVPEFVLSHQAQALVGEMEFQSRLKALRDLKWVDYTEVLSTKLTVLSLLYKEFKSRHLDNNTDRAKVFLQFVDQGGESLRNMALFDVLCVSLKKHDALGWASFPPEFQNCNSDEVFRFAQENDDSIQFNMYLQWIADNQFHEVQEMAKDKGMAIGVYRDLAVGVSKYGADTWVDEQILVKEASIGAPPDILGPLGQNWGLPPFSPQKLRENRYKPFIELLRANMKHCGALRIDHVLGLLRLWWIPEGNKAKEGAYVTYRIEELLGILALESHRNQCTIIGEDLGTVPAEMTSILAEYGIYSYKVFFFERNKNGVYRLPANYPSQSMATICTHDMPTLSGFWEGSDLYLGQKLGLYPDAGLFKRLLNDRERIRKGLLNLLRDSDSEAVLSDTDESGSVSMSPNLSEFIQTYAASCNSEFFSMQIEDWLNMSDPVNVPGTVDQYPNWRRKLCADVEDVFYIPSVCRLTERVNKVRANLKL
ncbi:4-alpha-glucanotransferase [Vibrio salinus]|uniref:4-alpha-glucanotransferase n=1 Tax=Vibrio salinus TaxID=2899784 RepID=UPI001E37D6A4|nr:4-alpha-glucanotransferase [Vibrio salinus]MCE0495955.1 4-alpha-glucanotransferase [Vibrio salinus]